jgi:hypothetical protein
MGKFHGVEAQVAAGLLWFSRVQADTRHVLAAYTNKLFESVHS